MATGLGGTSTQLSFFLRRALSVFPTQSLRLPIFPKRLPRQAMFLTMRGSQRTGVSHLRTLTSQSRCCVSRAS